jgi:hypothetical protein
LDEHGVSLVAVRPQLNGASPLVAGERVLADSIND